MKISITYESCWRNSFLQGDNNQPLPRHGRDYIASGQNLRNADNFLHRQVTLDTVMGVLNRLIGDQRKLYHSRAADNYFFQQIESRVSWQDHTQEWGEMVYLRNMSGSFDQNSFTGAIRTNHPLLSADYAPILWGVLDLSFEELCKLIVDTTTSVQATARLHPLTICERFAEIGKLKPADLVQEVEKAHTELLKHFPETNYLTSAGKAKPIHFYCSALYLQLQRLEQHYDISSALSRSGTITGVSKRNFTKKDFMDKFTTGRKKLVWGNPYVMKQRIAGEGEVTSALTKASGLLGITLDIDPSTAQQLATMIDCAGVSTFYLGKKGLAYVTDIRL